MKVLILILSTVISWQAGAEQEELSLKQQFEQTKDGAYSKWTENDRKKITGLISNIVNVFATKIVNEQKAHLVGLSLDINVPARASLNDVTSIGYMKAVDMIPVSNQKNVTYEGRNQILCKLISESTAFGMQINLKADCVQSGPQWRIFEVHGKATIKDIDAMNQWNIEGATDISNFQITISGK